MKYLSLLALLIFIMSCTPTKSTEDVVIEEIPVDAVDTEPDDEPIVTTCEKVATVKDNSGLDGCKYLIVLESGQKLEPLVMEDKSFKFRDGQRIRLTYEPEREMMSICMGGMGVRVTCIEEIK